MIWVIVAGVVIFFCLIGSAYGFKEKDEELVIASVVVSIIAIIILGIIAAGGGWSYSYQISTVQALKTNMPIQLKELGKLEAEHAARSFASAQDMIVYLEEHQKVMELRETVRNDLREHNKLVGSLRNSNPWLNPLVWFDKRGKQLELIKTYDELKGMPEPADANQPAETEDSTLLDPQDI